MTQSTPLFTAPNIVSMLRLLMAPLALGFAIAQWPAWFLVAIAFSIFTDLLDGFLARMLDQITPLGSRLDSWGDFLIYSTMAAGAALLWRQRVMEYQLSCLVIILSFTVPTLIGLIKYRSLTSYHTWSVKMAVAATVIGYFLLFTDTLPWPFYIAALLCAIAAIEETLITVLLKENTPDVRSVFHALRMMKHRRTTNPPLEKR